MANGTLRAAKLVGAERLGGLNEDLYRIQPANTLDAGVELGLLHVFGDGSITRKPPVLLWHGIFGSHRYFYGDGVGIAQKLARSGFDVWVADWRGHGFSPSNPNAINNTVWDFVDHDLPAILAFIARYNELRPRLVGVDVSGLMMLASSSLAKLPVKPESITMIMDYQSDVLARLNGSIFTRKAQWRWMSRGHVTPAMVGFGNESEPYGFVRSAVKWLQGSDRFVKQNELLCVSMNAQEIPCLIIENMSHLKSGKPFLGRLASMSNAVPWRSKHPAACYDADFKASPSAFNHPDQEVWTLLTRWVAGEYAFVRERRQVI